MKEKDCVVHLPSLLAPLAENPAEKQHMWKNIYKQQENNMNFKGQNNPCGQTFWLVVHNCLKIEMGEHFTG